MESSFNRERAIEGYKRIIPILNDTVLPVDEFDKVYNDATADLYGNSREGAIGRLNDRDWLFRVRMLDQIDGRVVEGPNGKSLREM